MNLDVCPDCGGEVVMVEGTLTDYHSRCVNCGQEYATPDFRRWRRVPSDKKWTPADTVYLAALCSIFVVWFAAGVMFGGQF